MHNRVEDTTFTITVANTNVSTKKEIGWQVFMMWIISVMKTVCYKQNQNYYEECNPV